MPLRKLEQQRRLVICELIIELMQPAATGVDVAPLDAVVLAAVCVSTFGPHHLSAAKIAETTGWPETNVRRALRRMVDLGRIVKVSTHYEVAPDFQHTATRFYDIRAKGKAIHRASARMKDLSQKFRAPIRRPNAVEPAPSLSMVEDKVAVREGYNADERA